jgi:ent-kaurene oxidase
VLVGNELYRNPEWVRLLTDTTIKVMISAQVIRFIYPPRLRWLSRWLVSGSRAVSRNRKCAAKLLLPIIEKRIAASGEDGERKMDGIQWLLDSKKGEKSAQQLAKEVADEELFLSIASIHSSSASMLSFTYDLLEHREYLDEIMDEVRQTQTKYPEWTLQTLGKLRKLDSFMKESQRIHPVGMGTSLSLLALSPKLTTD